MPGNKDGVPASMVQQYEIGIYNYNDDGILVI